MVAVSTPETGTIGPSHNKSVTFNSSGQTSASSAKEKLEKQMKELEDRKEEMKKAIQEAANKKEDTKSLPITA